VTVPEGQTTAPFTVTTVPVAAQVSVGISATVSLTKTATLIIKQPVVSALSLSPSSLKGGANSTGTVTLTGIAPTGGIQVALSSDRLEATVPATITVAAGQKSVQFTIKTTAVSALVYATVAAVTGTVSKSKVLTISP
jgi:ribosomal protein L11